MNSLKSLAIIGRGIAGLTAAYHLVKAGYRPTVYGQKEAGHQASRAAQGILCNKGLIFYGSPLFKAKLESLSSMQSFLRELESESGHPLPRFFQGVCEPYWDAADYQATLSRVYRHKFLGCHQTEDQAGWRALPESTREPLGVLHYPQDGWFDPEAVLNALEAYLGDRGIKFLEDKVTGFSLSGDGGILLHCGLSTATRFDELILAAGAGSEELWRAADLPAIKLFHIGGQTLSGSRERADEAKAKILVKGNQSVALLAERFILGSSSWKGFEPLCMAADRAALLARTEEAFGLQFTPDASRWGVRLRFSDRMPLVGYVTTGRFANKIYLLTGFYKNGMHLAEICARDMLWDVANKAYMRRYPEFSPLRFSV